ncbi:MAG: carboxy-S-adenosyl-L-methionine synthase CmoA [Aestuariibacter sp.]
MNKDLIYSQPQSNVADFQFDRHVVDVFPDMIQRSVPGYATIVDSIGQLCARYAQNDSIIYDLGCSLGEATLAARRYLGESKVSMIAIDNSKAMIERCQMHLAAFKSDIPVTVLEQDILDTEIKQASVVIMNFTLQFIAPEKREALLQKIFDGLLPGGVLILSEKVSVEGGSINATLVELHHEFKRRNGYSELEISQKRTALEKVMRLEDQEMHLERLKQLGFAEAHTWFQCFNFSSMLALKKVTD